MVRLVVFYRLFFRSSFLRFNSSMVRLVVLSIAAFEMLDLRFNSSMVRLVDLENDREGLYDLVSIPVWCDWWFIKFLKMQIFRIVSIPVWCDWWNRFRPNDKIDFFVSIPVWCDWWPFDNHKNSNDSQSITIPFLFIFPVKNCRSPITHFIPGIDNLCYLIYFQHVKELLSLHSQ